MDVEEDLDSILIPEPPERGSSQPEEEKLWPKDDDDENGEDDIQFEDNYHSDEEKETKIEMKLLPGDVLDNAIFGPVANAVWPIGMPFVLSLFPEDSYNNP